MAVGEQGTIDWHPLGAQGKPQGAAGDTGASSTIEPTLEMDEPGLEDSAIGMPAIWTAPPERSHANPPVTGMEITSDTAASRPVRRKEARIIVSIYRLNPRKKVIRVEFAMRSTKPFPRPAFGVLPKLVVSAVDHWDAVVGTFFEPL